MRFLAIHAHPDDIEFLCAGTLALLKQDGHEIVLATVTNGDKGSLEYSLEETARIRKTEGRRAAEVLDAAYHCLDFGDYEVFEGDAQRRRVTEFLREVDPDVILTASPQDYHPDHEASSRLVREAAFIAGAKNYQTGAAPATGKVCPLYYMDPAEGTNLFGEPVQPDFIVDVSSCMEIKKEMLARHESQRAWLKAHHGMDCYIDEMEKWSRRRGETFGLKYGEGFRRHRGHGFPQDPVLEKALPGDLVKILRED
ncbi:MAG: PIG-L family deacetylase [bacterium]|nr:PIG-L family deacetylase [bacterium]